MDGEAPCVHFPEGTLESRPCGRNFDTTGRKPESVAVELAPKRVIRALLKEVVIHRFRRRRLRDGINRRIRFQEQEEKNPKCQGRIEWFMSKPDLGGYGEIVPDGGLEAAIGKILIHEAQLGRNVPTSGSRVAFRIQKSQEEKGRAIAVDVEIVQPTTTRNAPQSNNSSPQPARSVTSRRPTATATSRPGRRDLRGRRAAPSAPA